MVRGLGYVGTIRLFGPFWGPFGTVAFLEIARTKELPSRFPVMTDRSIRENCYRVVAHVLGARARVGRYNTAIWAI